MRRDIPLANARDQRLIRTYAGAERLLTFEMVLEEFASHGGVIIDADEYAAPVRRDIADLPATSAASRQWSTPERVLAEVSDLSNACFLITPIGSEGTPERKHANLLLGSLLEPAR